MNSEDKKVLTNKNRRVLRAVLKILMVLFSVIAIIVAVALIRGRLIDVRKYSVPAHSLGKVRIAAITDLHGHMLGKDQERIVGRVQNAEPDIIVYLGDMVERSKAAESMESLVILTRQLIEIAPVYYVDGNHEGDVRANEPEIYEVLNEALAEMGAVQLENETIQLTLDGGCVVNICGITTHYHWEDKENEAVAELREQEGINVLLCHYPESVLWYNAFGSGGLDLALCGHTHGGLVHVPFMGGLYAPEWGLWPMYDFGEYPIYSDTDWHHYGGGEGMEYRGTMIISGGLAGEYGVPRINNPMEISVVEVGE